WPVGNCFTISAPPRSGKWRRRYGSRRTRSNSSPSRTGLAPSCKFSPTGKFFVASADMIASSLYLYLPMREELRISKVRSSIIRTQSKPVGGQKKFAIRTVAHHPCGFQRSFRGKIKRALHGYTHRSAGAEDGDLLAAAAVRRKLRQATLHAGAEFCPRF